MENSHDIVADGLLVPCPRSGNHRRDQPNQTDIANKAGVTQPTVSRVFADPSKVSALTVAKVMAVASEIGYIHVPQVKRTRRPKGADSD